MRRMLLAAACAVAVISAVPAGALASPTVTLQEECVRAADGTVLSYGVTLNHTGFPPGTVLSGSLTYPDGSVLTGSLSADESGTATFTGYSATPGVFTLRSFSPTVFERSLNVTCSPRPTSAQQCKDGGWRRYGIFKNQGDCVSFIATGGRNAPGAVPA